VTPFEVKAVDQGLKIRSQMLSPVVSYDRTYPVPERRRLQGRRDGYDVLEVVPLRREERKRVKGGDQRCDIVYVRGSLYDEEERWQQRREQGKTVISTPSPDRTRPRTPQRRAGTGTTQLL